MTEGGSILYPVRPDKTLEAFSAGASVPIIAADVQVGINCQWNDQERNQGSYGGSNGNGFDACFPS